MGEAVAALLGQARIGREVRGLPTGPSSVRPPGTASPSSPLASGVRGGSSTAAPGFQVRATLEGSRLGRGYP